MSAKRFLWRWSVRLLRREWRQHVGVFVLIAASVALAVGSVVAAFNLSEQPEFRYGSGRLRATVLGDPLPAATALEAQSHPYGAIESATLTVAGSTLRVEVREQDPQNAVTAPLLDLVDGRWPTSADEIAVTDAAPMDGREPGRTVELGGATVTIVGVVENPTDLNDEFVLAGDLAAYDFDPATQSTLFLVDALPADVTFPAGTGRIDTEDRGGGVSVRTGIAIAVNVVAAVALFQTALLVGAAFAVLARRRGRQYGLLGAAGATPRHLRWAASFTGLALGLAAAAFGTVLGLLVTLAAVPRMEETVSHRIDLAIPWWSVVPTVLLAVASATVAAWWPSRALSREPLVHVLASLRPRPSSAAGSTRLGLAGAVIGSVLLAFGTVRLSATLVVLGIITALAGLLLLAPALIEFIGRRAAGWPLSGRLAGRAIARHQGRSAALVAALTVALGIPVGLAVVTASIDRHNATKAPNLPETMAIAWLPGAEEGAGAIPADLGQKTDGDATSGVVGRLLAATPDARIAPIQVAVNPDGPTLQATFERLGTALAAEPTGGIRPFDGNCGLSCDVATFGDRDEDGAEILVTPHDAWIGTTDLLAALGADSRQDDPTRQAVSRFEDTSMSTHRGQGEGFEPNVAFDPTLPANPSIAPTFIWPSTVSENGWDAVTVGWLVVAAFPLSDDHASALADAAGDDVLIETTAEAVPASGVRAIGIVVGGVVSLGILLAALSLLAADSAGDLRILQSIGADPARHRRLAASAAAILTGAGALLAVPVGYLALIVLLANRSMDYPFVFPWRSLLSVTVVVPLLAAAVGWLSSRTRTTRLAVPS